jgi:hypothetical protein
MYDVAGENEFDLKALRARLRRMADDALNRFGQAARYMCSLTMEGRGVCSLSD